MIERFVEILPAGSGRFSSYEEEFSYWSEVIMYFTVIFEHEEDGGFHAFVPALRGCHSQGDTFEEAEENIREAIDVYIESLRAGNEAIPNEDILIKPLEIAV